MRNDWQILIPRKTKWLRLIIKSGRSDFLNYQKVFPVQYTENLYLDYIVRAVNLLQGYFFSFRVYNTGIFSPWAWKIVGLNYYVNIKGTVAICDDAKL